MTELNVKAVVAEISTLDPKPGQILLVKLGGDLGDDLGPWIPSEEDLDYVNNQMIKAVPDGVSVLVTHGFFDASIIDLEEGDTVKIEKA